MQTELKHMHQELEEIKESIDFIKNILAENYDLSDRAKKQLKIAGKTPVSKYIDHKDVKKRLLR